MGKLHIATYQRDIFNKIPVAEHLKRDIKPTDFSVVVRLGGSMPYNDYQIHVNSAESVKNSINKLIQKNLLIKAGLPVLPILNEVNYPCVLKGIVRSGGLSVFVINNEKEYNQYSAKLNNNFTIEPLFNTTSEYRLHCTRKEVFFEVKKVKRVKEDVIITRDNHFNKRDFLKPRLWAKIKEDCLKAINVLDLDICCFDVIYDSSNNAKHTYAICEANTNPELLHNTYLAYVKALDDIIASKIQNYKVVDKLQDKVFIEVKPKAKQQIVLSQQQKDLLLIKLITNDFVINNNTIVISVN